MIQRILYHQITEALDQFPAVVITGPRQVGKTTLARMLFESYGNNAQYLDLELPSDLARIQNPELFLTMNQDKLLIIDEVQRLPELFPVLRAMIDRHRVPGRFLLLGSASPQLMKFSSESLAGRVLYLELTSLLLPEISSGYDQTRLWIAGGFPEPFLISTPEKRRKWTSSFLRTYIERDLPAIGIPSNPLLMNRLFSMIAYNHGMLQNTSNLSKSLGISVTTIIRWLDYLEHAYLVRRLPPYHQNLKKRLVKSPKIYLRDSGLLHHLLGIGSINNLLGHPMAGNSWEGFIIEQIAGLCGKQFDYSFYRTQDGTECDLVISSGIRVLACIGIKLTDHPTISRGFTISVNDLQPAKSFILIPNLTEPYYLKENVMVTDATRFLENFHLWIGGL